MRSCTSSSESRWRRLLRVAARERMLRVVGVAAVLLVLHVRYAPRDQDSAATPLERTELLTARRCADCVWAGDSRTGAIIGARQRIDAGLLPARTKNFSFPLARFTDGYLDAIEDLLDPAAADAVIVLGITPHGLTRTAQSEGWFERRVSQRRFTRLLGFELPAPMRIDQLASWPFEAGAAAVDASVSADAPADKAALPDSQARSRRELAWYRRTFAEIHVSTARIDAVLERVRTWSQRGIRVYGLRPPASTAAVAVEAASGFDQASFARRFASAGGVWIELPIRDWPTTDAMHLTKRAAAEVLGEVARVIAGDESSPSGIASR